MKATIKLSSDGKFQVCLFGETPAERDMLKRMGEQRHLGCYYDGGYDQRLVIYPVEPATAPSENA